MTLHQCRRKLRPARAFTLVRVLVVIGIIALLISILMPALSAAKERANRVKCASNLRQIGQGLLLYAGDNRGVYPRTPTNGGAGFTCFTGAIATDPFGIGGPRPHPVTPPPVPLVGDAGIKPPGRTFPSPPPQKDTPGKT